jgi:hypothetical protein
MDRLKRVFQCVNSSVQDDETMSKKSHEGSETDQSVKKREFYIQYAAQYKQQHLVALAESQAIFEKQKLYIEKCLQNIHLNLEKLARFQAQQQGKDSEWVKFE